jgi:hypothetical protein
VCYVCIRSSQILALEQQLQESRGGSGGGSAVSASTAAVQLPPSVLAAVSTADGVALSPPAALPSTNVSLHDLSSHLRSKRLHLEAALKARTRPPSGDGASPRAPSHSGGAAGPGEALATIADVMPPRGSDTTAATAVSVSSDLCRELSDALSRVHLQAERLDALERAIRHSGVSSASFVCPPAQRRDAAPLDDARTSAMDLPPTIRLPTDDEGASVDTVRQNSAIVRHVIVSP